MGLYLGALAGVLFLAVCGLLLAAYIIRAGGDGAEAFAKRAYPEYDPWSDDKSSRGGA